VKEVLAQANFIQVVPEVLKDTALNVKQSAFALVGDSAKICPEYLHPFLPQVLPQCNQVLRANLSPSVSNNAAWSIGEICFQVGPDFMAPYLDDTVQALASVLQRGRGPPQVMTNVAITLGRLATVSGAAMGKHFESFAKPWCQYMAIQVGCPPDMERVKAFHGMSIMLKANPQACMGCFPELCRAVCALWPLNANPQIGELQAIFKGILTEYKAHIGANWPQVYGTLSFPPFLKPRLAEVYQITA
jgi:transportin-1